MMMMIMIIMRTVIIITIPINRQWWIQIKKKHKKLSYRRDSARRRSLCRSRWFKDIEFGTSGKPVCNFLLVNNRLPHLHLFSYPFQSITKYWWYFRFGQGYLSFSVLSMNITMSYCQNYIYIFAADSMDLSLIGLTEFSSEAIEFDKITQNNSH